MKTHCGAVAAGTQRLALTQEAVGSIPTPATHLGFSISDFGFEVIRVFAWASARSEIENPKSEMSWGLMVQQKDAGPANRRFGCDSRWVHFSKRHGPVVQRRRLLAYTQATMVRVHPGSIHFGFLISDFGFGERSGATLLQIRNPQSQIRNGSWLGRQSADHPRLERRMLRVQIPPEPLNQLERLWRSGVLVSLSRRRSRVQIPSDALERHGTQTGKAAKLKPS